MWRERRVSITSSARANSSIAIVGCDMISRASVAIGSRRRSAFTTSVSLTKPTRSPPGSTTGTPPSRSATSVAAMAASGVPGSTDTTRSVIMLRAWPLTPHLVSVARGRRQSGAHCQAVPRGLSNGPSRA
jgi:hypothetical protein